MADPSTVANTGVDPTTGSYLSRESRLAIFRNRSIQSAAAGFGGGGGTDPQTSAIVKRQNITIVQLQNEINAIKKSQSETLGVFQKEIGNIQNNMQVISVNVRDLGASIKQSNQLLSTDAQLEKQQTLQEQLQESRLAEQGIREGKERELESRIQSAILAPIRLLTNKTQSIFQKLQQALFTFFAGWLTNSVLTLFQQQSNNNQNRVQEIFNNIISSINIVFRSMGVVKDTLSSIIKVVSGTVGLVTKFIGTGIGKLFGGLATIAGKAVGIRGTPIAPEAPGKGGKPGGKPAPRGPGLINTAQAGIGAVMNFQSGEYTDAAVSALGAAPGLLGASGRIVSFADDMAEMAGFRGGAGILGNTPRGGNKPQSPTSPNPPGALAPGQRPDKALNKEQFAAAQKARADGKASGMTGQDLEKYVANAVMAVPQAPAAIQPVEAAAPPTPTQTPEVTPSAKMAPAPADLSFNFDASKMSGEMDFNQPAQYGNVSVPIESGESQNATQSPSASITPAQTQSIPTPPAKVGEVPEPKPNVVMMSSVPGAQGPGDTVLSSQPGAASDVPQISSSNPDNFYALYSQINYNVLV